MRVHILPCAVGSPGHPLTGLVIDRRLAVDAGSLAALPVDEQVGIADVLLTHSHIDHVCGLPLLLDTVYGRRPTPPAVHALPETLAVLRSDLFNNRLWPDFVSMGERMPPFVSLHPLTPDRPVAVGGYTVTPIPLKHGIPTAGYLIDDRTSAVAILTDTAPMPDTFAAVARWPRLKAAFIECSFPDAQAELARISHHLTAAQFAAAARLFPKGVKVFAIHVKPAFADEVKADLRGHGLPADVIADGGKVWEG